MSPLQSLRKQITLFNLMPKTWILYRVWVKVMMFNATVNNISAISRQSVLLVDETGVPGENNRPATSH